MTAAQSSDIVVTLERMEMETALSWSDIRKPQEHGRHKDATHLRERQ